MAGVLISLLAGIAVGLLLRRRDRLILVSERATTGSICLLLFLLGLSVGSNNAVMGNLGELGVQSFILCAGGIVGSVFMAFMVYTFFFRKEEE